jgi:hypothetical protein
MTASANGQLVCGDREMLAHGSVCCGGAGVDACVLTGAGAGAGAEAESELDELEFPECVADRIAPSARNPTNAIAAHFKSLSIAIWPLDAEGHSPEAEPGGRRGG